MCVHIVILLREDGGVCRFYNESLVEWFDGRPYFAKDGGCEDFDDQRIILGTGFYKL